MLCVKCKIEMRRKVHHSPTIEDDKAYQIADWVCENKKCEEYGKVQETEKIEIRF